MHPLHDILVDLVPERFSRQVTVQEVIVLLDQVICAIDEIFSCSGGEHGQVLQEHSVSFHDVHVVEWLLLLEILKLFFFCHFCQVSPMLRPLHNIQIQECLILLIVGLAEGFKVRFVFLSELLDHRLYQSYVEVPRPLTLLRILQFYSEANQVTVMQAEPVYSFFTYFSYR